MLEQDIDTTLKTLTETKQRLEKNVFLAKIFDKVQLEKYVSTTKEKILTEEH